MTAMIKIIAAASIIPAAFIFTTGVLHANTPDVVIVNSAVEEDSPEWSCATMGNHVCGPNNVDGINAGCYDDDAEMVAPWPCHTYVDNDGERNVVYDTASFNDGAMYKIEWR